MDSDITGLYSSNRQASVAYHIISQPQRASLALCKCVYVCVCCMWWSSVTLPSLSLSLPVLLGPWGQSSPFLEENGIRKNVRDKREHRGRVCHELFMFPGCAWCFTACFACVCMCVLRCSMDFTISSNKHLGQIFLLSYLLLQSFSHRKTLDKEVLAQEMLQLCDNHLLPHRQVFFYLAHF